MIYGHRKRNNDSYQYLIDKGYVPYAINDENPENRNYKLIKNAAQKIILIVGLKNIHLQD